MQKQSRRIVTKTIATKLVNEPLQRSHWLQVLAAYLIDCKQVDSIDLVVNDLLREIAALSGEVLVTVQTARSLQANLRRELVAMLHSELQAKRIVLEETVEPDLLGGFIIETPDAILDASVRSKLRQLASLD